MILSICEPAAEGQVPKQGEACTWQVKSVTCPKTDGKGARITNHEEDSESPVDNLRKAAWQSLDPSDCQCSKLK